ncbi:MAG: hypothetical protein JXA78_13775 [Anaerolineales bacterium]|nr:hypothetical protein [Anaerolineales bacterium]
MKKVILLVLLAVLASILAAAAPIQMAEAPGGVGADQDDLQKQKLCFNPLLGKWVPCDSMIGLKYKYPGQGEPRMEKVAYFKYLSLGNYGWGDSKCEISGVMSNGCYSWYYCIRTYKLPVGCNFRYQY